MTVREIIYVATRIYREAKIKNPNLEARKFAEWITRLPTIEVVEISKEIAMMAGEIKIFAYH